MRRLNWGPIASFPGQLARLARALRAAEMDVLGLEGVGQIYTWYRRGVVTRDDDVALMFGFLSGELPGRAKVASCAAWNTGGRVHGPLQGAATTT